MAPKIKRELRTKGEMQIDLLWDCMLTKIFKNTTIFRNLFAILKSGCTDQINVMLQNNFMTIYIRNEWEYPQVFISHY